MEHKIRNADSAFSSCSAAPLINALAGNGLGSSASASFNKAFAIEAANILQALVWLNVLIQATAEDSGKVRLHARATEERLQALGELMRPMLWNPA
ncbi:MAG TPA: hypothetical protein VK638_17070 [Edaphobacter sp.]|nr:hypothetical protein [Edaphobacter sp.]